jgi:hypothetical protein
MGGTQYAGIGIDRLCGLPQTSILPVETQFSDSGCRAPLRSMISRSIGNCCSELFFDQDAAVMALGLDPLLPCGG